MQDNKRPWVAIGRSLAHVRRRVVGDGMELRDLPLHDLRSAKLSQIANHQGVLQKTAQAKTSKFDLIY